MAPFLKQNSGIFISFEGIDGSGKSTQLTRCAEALETLCQNKTIEPSQVIVTKNPGGTVLGKAIRHILLDPSLSQEEPFSPSAELLLYMADRAQHVETFLRPVLKQKAIVLCDRFSDSTLAYQGFGRGLNKEQILQLNQLATDGLNPDLTFLFDGPPEQLAQRVSKRGSVDRIEQETLAFRHRVREGFLTLAKEHASRIVVLDALESEETLHEQVMNALKTRFLEIAASPSKI
jgi:dTMP kinase